jgi:hypothetical protein
MMLYSLQGVSHLDRGARVCLTDRVTVCTAALLGDLAAMAV